MRKSMNVHQIQMRSRHTSMEIHSGLLCCLVRLGYGWSFDASQKNKPMKKQQFRFLDPTKPDPRWHPCWTEHTTPHRHINTSALASMLTGQHQITYSSFPALSTRPCRRSGWPGHISYLQYKLKSKSPSNIHEKPFRIAFSVWHGWDAQESVDPSIRQC